MEGYQAISVFNHLLDKQDFMNEVRTAWAANLTGNPWSILTSSLKVVKNSMIKLNKAARNLHFNGENARANILSFQTSISTAST